MWVYGIFNMQTLWCSWILEGENKRVYFAGDTGFCTVSKESTHPGGDTDKSPEPSTIKSWDLNS
jgi:L-ascorbate metabolism protein UlaG (beta-lactamase superfamily)